MDDAWNVLRQSGVPVGAARPAPAGHLDPVALREAVTQVTARGGALTEREADPLYAWLRAFRQHWPSGFASILGDAGTAALATLATRSIDPNRYLKLRRIAITNLAGVI